MSVVTEAVDARAEVATRVDDAPRGRVELGLVVLAFALVVTHLVRGAGFVLDDWFYLRNAEFLGTGQTVIAGGDRPFGQLIYTFFYGVIGPHPLPHLLIMASLTAAAAVVFHRIVRHFAGDVAAVAAAVAWLVVPSRLSLEFWSAVSQAVVAQLCALLVLVILLRRDRRAWHGVAAVVLTMIALWSYESVAALLLPGVVAVQWLDRRRLDWPITIGIGIGAAVAGAWSFVNWNADRDAEAEFPELTLVLPANFRWPFTTNAQLSTLVMILVLVFALAVIGGAILDPARRGVPHGLVTAGFVVLALGTTPFVRYLYEPLGVGDRANYLSAFGAALVWAGLFVIAWEWRREVAFVSAGVLLVMAFQVRMHRGQLWTTAAEDAERIAAAVAAVAEPGRPVIVGPGRVIEENVAPFADTSGLDAAVQMSAGTTDVQAIQNYDPADWPPEVDGVTLFDLTTVAEIELELKGRSGAG